MGKLRVMCNASPVIGLLGIDRLPLLWQLFDEVLIPEAVYNELCADSLNHESEVALIRKHVEAGDFIIYKVENSAIVKSLYGKLHYGELEVIIGAKECEIPLALIDERAARKMAAEFLVDTMGILGILSLAKKRGILLEIKPDVDKLRTNGYHISDSLYKQILLKNGE